MASFYCSRLSSAQLDCWQAPKQRPIIDRYPVVQPAYRNDIKIRLYKFLAGTSKEPVVDKEISELIHWRQCHLSGATEPCPLGFRETLACIHVILHNVTAMCGMLSRLPAKLAKNGMRVKTSADWRLKKKLAGLNGIWCELVNTSSVIMRFWFRQGFFLVQNYLCMFLWVKIWFGWGRNCEIPD